MNHFLIHLAVLVALVSFAQNLSGQSPCSGTEALTAGQCIGDENTPTERDLFELVNNYRISNGRPPLKLSVSLSLLANRRMLDIRHNMKTLTHSWSNCPYDLKQEDSWHCVLDAPLRFNSGYSGKGMETLFRTTGGSVVPVAALEAWKKSTLHNSIILNLGNFATMPWDEVGIAIDGQYAAVWFGSPGSKRTVPSEGELGLGSDYESVADAISRILTIRMSPGPTPNEWTGVTSDDRLACVLTGTSKDIGGASIALSMKLDPGQRLDHGSPRLVLELLQKIFPEWNDAGAWLGQSIGAIEKGPIGISTKVVRKIGIELRNNGKGSVMLHIRPVSKPSKIQEF